MPPLHTPLGQMIFPEILYKQLGYRLRARKTTQQRSDFSPSCLSSQSTSIKSVSGSSNLLSSIINLYSSSGYIRQNGLQMGIGQIEWRSVSRFSATGTPLKNWFTLPCKSRLSSMAEPSCLAIFSEKRIPGLKSCRYPTNSPMQSRRQKVTTDDAFAKQIERLRQLHQAMSRKRSKIWN